LAKALTLFNQLLNCLRSKNSLKSQVVFSPISRLIILSIIYF